MLDETLAPASRHTLAAAISTANPRLANHPPGRTLRDGGQKSPVGGHIDTRELWEGEAGADGGATKRRTSAAPSGCHSFVGTVEKGTLAKGPLCDLSNALSLSSAPGKMTFALWWASTRLAASCCHPVRQSLGFESAGGDGGRAPCANSSHVGGSNSITPDRSRRAISADTRLGGPMPSVNCVTMVSATALCLLLTMERVSGQTCPIRCLPRAKGASETQSAQTEGKCHSVSDCRLHVWRNLANGAQTTPHSFIMACRELLCQLRPQNSQLVIRSTGGAVQQQRPRALDVLQNWDAFQECLVLFQHPVKMSSHEILMSQRSSEHLDTLFIRDQCTLSTLAQGSLHLCRFLEGCRKPLGEHRWHSTP